MNKEKQFITPGTTPTHTFRLPFPCDCLAEAWVSYEQNGKICINKELKDCEMQDYSLILHLTQEDTLALECYCTTKIQVRCKDTEGNAYVSKPKLVYTEEVLKRGTL